MAIQPNTSSPRLYAELLAADCTNGDSASLNITQNFLTHVLKSNEIGACAPLSRDAIDDSYLQLLNFINQITGELGTAMAPSSTITPTVMPTLEEIEMVYDMDDETWYELATPQQDSDMNN